MIPHLPSSRESYAAYARGVMLAIARNPWIRYLAQADILESLVALDVQPGGDGFIGTAWIDDYDHATAVALCQRLKREIIAATGSVSSIRDLI